MQNGIPLTAEQQLAADRALRRPGRLGHRLMRAALRRARGRGPATPRSSGASRSPRTWAAPATRWSSHWPERIRDAGGLRSQFTHVHRRRRRPSSKPPGSPSPKPVDGIEQKPMHGTSFLYTLRPTPARPSGTPSSTSRSSATGRCTRTAGGWRCRIDRGSPGTRHPDDAEAVRARASGTPTQDPVGALLPARRLHPGQRPRRRAPREGRGAARSCSGRRPRSTTSCRCWRGLSFFFGILPPLPDSTTFSSAATSRTSPPGMIPRDLQPLLRDQRRARSIPDRGAEGVIVAEADHLGGFSLYVARRQAASTPTR